MKFCKITLIILAAVGLVGCTSMREPEAINAEANLRDGAVFKMMPEVFEKGKYNLLAAQLSPEMREIITQERFDEMLRDLRKNGDINRVEYLTMLRSPVVECEIWKIELVKRNLSPDSKAAGINEIYSDKLVRVVAGRLDGRMVIVGLLIQ